MTRNLQNSLSICLTFYKEMLIKNFELYLVV